MALAAWQQNEGRPDAEVMRRLIAEILAEQTFGPRQTAAIAGGLPSEGYQYPTEGSDPADYSTPGLSAPLDSIANPTNTDITNAAFDAIANQAPADTAAMAHAQQSVNETANAQQAAMENSTLSQDVASALAMNGPAQAVTAGLPAGFFNTGFNTPGETISGAPVAQAAPQAQQAFDQGLTFGGRNIAGHNIAPAFDAFEGAPVAPTPATPTPHSIVGDRFGEMQAPAINVDTGYGNPAAFEAADQAMSALNDAVAAQMADALAGYSVTGTPTGTPTGAPAAQASTGNVATDVGVGIGLGISGGFGGATGDGTSGGMGADVGGPGVGGSSTGISGGPGGTGEGGANTGEGGTSSGDSGSSGGAAGGDGGK